VYLTAQENSLPSLCPSGSRRRNKKVSLFILSAVARALFVCNVSCCARAFLYQLFVYIFVYQFSAVMRLGKKKEKDKESEMRTVDGITRLICLSKGQTPLKGNVYNFNS
jgi:hypothetical protein